jgi:TolA-binding protein
LYWRGECYLAKGRFLKAIGEFERLGKRYPDSEKVPSGLYRIGFVYDKLKDFKTAVRYYFEVVEKYPGTDAARRAGNRVQEIQNRPNGGAIPTAVTR